MNKDAWRAQIQNAFGSWLITCVRHKNQFSDREHSKRAYQDINNRFCCRTNVDKATGMYYPGRKGISQAYSPRVLRPKLQVFVKKTLHLHVDQDQPQYVIFVPKFYEKSPHTFYTFLLTHSDRKNDSAAIIAIK